MNRRAFLGLAGTATLGGAGLMMLNGKDALTVERRTLGLPRWTAGTVRLAVMSDFHVSSRHAAERFRRACELAAREKPDLVALPGDFTHFTRHDVIPQLSWALEALDAFSCPVIGVLGNHDYWASEPDRVIRTLGERMTLLRNQNFEHAGIGIFGIDDDINGRARYDFCHDMPENSVVLLHEPDAVRHVPRGAALMVAGHSHGGQFCLPGGVAVYAPVGGRRYISGFYSAAETCLYVTRGVGSIGEFRLFCPPEVSILTLKSA